MSARSSVPTGEFSLSLEVHALDGTTAELELRDPQLIVAGFTGRDPAVVARHVDELAAIGVAPPSQVPTFIPLPNWLLSAGAGRREVVSETTSGEVEPVLVELPDGRRYVAVGSDQTDRELERTSLQLSKLTCPKIVSRTVWPFEEVAGRWDELCVRSFLSDEDDAYQEGTLAELLAPLDLLARARALVAPERPLVLFLGTVPLKTATFAYDRRFTAVLRDPFADRELRCTYEVALAEGHRIVSAAGEAT